MTTITSKISVPATDLPAAATLSAEADHRIGNNLALVGALLRLQANDLATRSKPLPAEEVRGLLTETAARIEAVGRLHRLLADADGSWVDFSEYVRAVITSIVASTTAPGRATISFDLAPSCPLDAVQVMPLGLIVGEVVSNAIKYSHPAGLAPLISVGCDYGPTGLVLTIADDGVGLPDGFDPQTDGGLGFRLIRSLAAQIGAATRFDSNPLGLRFRLTLPA